MENFSGQEKRDFVRLDYTTPIACKICRKETIEKLLKGYTSNISQSGLLCLIKEPVEKDDILWLSFDRHTLAICEEIEKRVLIYQNGIIGKVTRVEQKTQGNFSVGLRFFTREEENLSHIYPKFYFTQKRQL
jgi:hypothetical protein